jgi:hypothetical protein
MAKYLHIGIVWNGPSKFNEVQALIDKVPNTDWFRYGGNCWLIHTSYTQTQWAEYIHPHLNQADQLLIYEVASLTQSDGWLPRKLWEWFRALRY